MIDLVDVLIFVYVFFVLLPLIGMLGAASPKFDAGIEHILYIVFVALLIAAISKAVKHT